MAGDKVQPFAIQGTVTDRSFSPGHVLASERKADFSFCYSNGWWEAQAVYITPWTGDYRTVVNCMTVPGGLRTFTLFRGLTNMGSTVAEACPLPFPPPGLPMLFPVWLSLCPNPELPVIDG